MMTLDSGLLFGPPCRYFIHRSRVDVKAGDSRKIGKGQYGQDRT